MKKIFYILASVLLLVALGIIGLSWYKKPVEVPKTVQTQIFIPADCVVDEKSIIDEVNLRRNELGLKSLVLNEKLDVMADYRAEEQNGHLDNHAGFRTYGNSHLMGDYFVSQNEIQNIELRCDAKTRIDLFENSAPHWKALTTPRYDSLGVGYFNYILVIELGDSR